MRFLITIVNYLSFHAFYKHLSCLKSYIRNMAALEEFIAK